MTFATREMGEADARAIMHWRYPPPYDLYNGEDSDDSLKEMVDGSYHVVTLQGELFGFYCAGKSAQVPAGEKFGLYPAGPVDIGLGMKPDNTGTGRGAAFLSYILRDIACHHPGKPLRLTVATFNARAIALYTQAGFIANGEFATDSASFQVMEKPSAGA
ncbi:GNAT family N-acetyltransferase [Planococcus dechangensis]|uniref:GNAT family N-acetyltransferase n=1 Tax=Planococcus dechangensis TaxID=1176255 RepID=A0ABV9MGB7_9BACL